MNPVGTSLPPSNSSYFSHLQVCDLFFNIVKTHICYLILQESGVQTLYLGPSIMAPPVQGWGQVPSETKVLLFSFQAHLPGGITFFAAAEFMAACFFKMRALV